MADDHSADDDSKKLSKKRGKDIQPLHEDEVKAKLAEDRDLQQANADVLAELAKKTAELAEKVSGADDPATRTLNLEEAKEPEDIFAALEANVKEHPDTIPLRGGDPNPAADLIREKLQKIYRGEPDAATEAAEAAVLRHRSKHQQFMYELTTSGKSLADIQTQWHNYYVALPDKEKHQVWQEFYSSQSRVSAYAKHTEKVREKVEKQSEKPHITHSPQVAFSPPPIDSRSTAQIKSQLVNKVTAGGKLSVKDHAKSAFFGLGLAGAVGLIIVIVFFNPVFIAPFISPSKSVSATPIIGDVTSPVGPEAEIIIPKINVEVPVVYDVGTIEERAIQNALEDGVVHYASSPEPGEVGNSVIVGHSSNNILNAGKYKFAFVLLNRLEEGDVFYAHKDGVRYTYKIYETKIVAPTEVSVLGPAAKPNSMTLITCDPPGTSRNRLIVVGEQISPNPSSNVAATIEVTSETEDAPLPGNAPSLWSRLWPL